MRPPDRRRDTELMDEAGVDPAELARSLADLERVKQVLTHAWWG